MNKEPSVCLQFQSQLLVTVAGELVAAVACEKSGVQLVGSVLSLGLS